MSLLHLKDCPQNCHNKRSPTRQPRIKKIEDDLKVNRRYTEVSFGETKVRMQLDSGADGTVINREIWEQIGSPTLEKTTTSLGVANGTPIEVLGQFDVQFTCGGHSGRGRCYVAENIEQLLGIEWMNQLPPLQRAFNAICCKIEHKPEEEGRHLAKVLAGGFPDVFREELGKCKTKAQLLLKQGTRPIFCRQRKIPFARKEAVNAELERLVQQVLKKVDYSNWAAPIVVVKKKGSVRICADFKTGLNEALEKAIAHASRFLTKAEKNYGQIEKEALALVFGVRKFHRYIYGRCFLLLTDHKPLLSIFGSKVGICAHSANRLQRWELVFLAYDFVFEYRRSTHFGQADALSRLIASKKLPEDEDIVIAKIEQDVRAVQGVQVGRMGYVPACGRNSNSRNVSCSQPSLHRQGAPSGRGAI